MYSGSVKAGVFALEGLNAVSTTYYFYYLYFFMQERFGFDQFRNLVLAATLGFFYTIGSVLCGRFAQRRGYFRSLRLGFLIMAVVLAMGSRISTVVGHLLAMIICIIGMCFTWPTLEAMVSEGEPPPRLQRMVGIYNLVWAGGGAFAYFTGGAMLEQLGLQSMFLVPCAMQMAQLALVFRLEKKSVHAQAGKRPGAEGGSPSPPVSLSDPREEGSGARAMGERAEGLSEVGPQTHSRSRGLQAGTLELNPRAIPRSRAFLKMAWLANPFAYLAINTVIAGIPSLARELKLSPMFAGFFCSVWLFVRVGAFALLWLWPGWHYRFRWLIGAYAAMVAGFALLLLAPGLPLLVAAQIVFGLAVGLIYYSSLFYSMDVGERKSEHGGIHEAAIGAGSCAGPAIGAAALHFFPEAPGSSAWAVSGMLIIGLAALTWLRIGK